jgi:hypothetical protein
MKNHLWMAVVFLALVTPSCTLIPSQTTETPPPADPPTLDTPTSSVPSPTPVPVETRVDLEVPVLTPTLLVPVSGVPLASPVDQPVNCRFGPATSYTVIGALNPGGRAEVIGKSADFMWWYVRNPSDPSTSCWVSAGFTVVEGDVESLPIVGPPQIMVTGINVSVDPPAMNVACDGLPQTVAITAQITTSGPATVFWYWESSTGEVSPEKKLLFEEGTTKTVQDFYTVRIVNDYAIQVRTTSPNVLAGQANFKVTCTP